MAFMKKIKVLLALLCIGVIIYVAPLSVETLAPLRPLMPWQQFFLACASRLEDKDAPGMEDSRNTETAAMGVPAVETGGAAKDFAMPGMIRVLLTHNQDGNRMFGKMRVSCNKSWQADGRKYGS